MHDDTNDGFRGFREAERLMSHHRSRARAHERLASTKFLGDDRVASVHAENTSRADRVFLIAFDADGEQIGADTVYVDDPSQRLDVAAEFDHDFTGMPVPEGSELASAIAREDGWVIDLSALRRYDPLEDRRATRRAMVLAHLADMVNDGSARGFAVGPIDGSESAS